MSYKPEWTESSLSEHYDSPNPINLGWLEKSSRHQFRWRTLIGPWVTAKKRISSEEQLVKEFQDSMPTDVYVSTSSWLDPVNLPRLSDNSRPSPILLDHLVVFDIDMRPFCERKLEAARLATLKLKIWLIENTHFEIQNVTFSGNKGFHLVAKDPNRALFAEPDPKLREQKVREQRKKLLHRVLSAGHPVDPTVTADTRRIIRLPGTIHGSTGWICSIIEPDWLEKPVNHWIGNIPRHELAINMPKKPPYSLPKFSFRRKLAKQSDSAFESEEFLSVEVSTHVQGTKDRSALMTYLPLKWGGPKRAISVGQKYFEELELGPVAYLEDGRSVLAIIPRAIPRDYLISKLTKAGLTRFTNDLRRYEHAWVRVSGRMAGDSWESELEPLTVLGYEASSRCRFPWSLAHLNLCERLGLPISVDSSDVAGSEEVAIRIAVRR
jgi:hypothetical protein